MAERADTGGVGPAGTDSDRRRGQGPSTLTDFASRLGGEEVRALSEELAALWRGDSNLGDRAAAHLAGVFRELGLVTRAELEEAQLRIAQLEHRLRLLESDREPQ